MERLPLFFLDLKAELPNMKLCLVTLPLGESVSFVAVTSIITQRFYLAYRRTMCLKKNEGNYSLINKRILND